MVSASLRRLLAIVGLVALAVLGGQLARPLLAGPCLDACDDDGPDGTCPRSCDDCSCCGALAATPAADVVRVAAPVRRLEARADAGPPLAEGEPREIVHVPRRALT
jgi:hypothetical protein